MQEAHAQGAAPVAAQLLAFLREPARFRPAYLHGREPLPPGSHVFKFAQGKLPGALLRELAPGDPARLQQAALAFIRQVCLWEGATHYQVLGAANGAPREAIKENYHLLMALIHPDRQDADSESWPADSAQRVNRAYAILGDEEMRRDYDAALRLMETGSLFTPDALAAEPPAGRERRRRRERMGVRFAKGLLVLTAVMGTLLLLEVWVSDVSGNYSMFHGAFTGPRASAAANRNGEPRFLGLWTPREAAPAEEPAQRASAPQRASKVSLPAPDVAAPAEKQVVAAPEPARAASPPVVAARAAEPKRTEAVALAQAPPPDTPAAKPGISDEAIEVMVARVVGYYEAGETEKLMALLDTSEAGFWQTARTRQAYSDFFRATRQRKLRVDSLAWSTADSSASARGEATVVAEYFDPPGTQERRVSMEMDIALRGGQARLTRLSLYPHTP